ncbi:hypothetical protein THAOC_22736, partial [Thalassiosira oceanica]
MLDEFNEVPTREMAIRVGLSDGANNLGSRFGLPIDFYGPNIKRNLLPTL